MCTLPYKDNITSDALHHYKKWCLQRQPRVLFYFLTFTIPVVSVSWFIFGFSIEYVWVSIALVIALSQRIRARLPTEAQYCRLVYHNDTLRSSHYEHECVYCTSRRVVFRDMYAGCDRCHRVLFTIDK